ncbi:MAG: exosortase C-terminal domain/associated protein EpsI [Terrimicrobiaceae bacterium]
MNIKLFVRGGIFLALAVAVFFLCRQSPDAKINMESGVNMTLPGRVGSLAGRSAEISESEKVMLPSDTQISKMLYSGPSGEQINCQVVLSGGEKRSIHRPETCLPAQGWTKKSSQAIPIKLDDGRTLQVTKLVIARPVEVQPGVRKEMTSLFLYWFVGKDITTPHHWYRILHTDWDRVVHGVSHRWAYVIVSAPVLDGFVPGAKNQEQTLDSMKAFIGEIAPEIIISKK